MSTESQEAKQAAEEAGYSPEGQGWSTFLHGYDTATAKLREELDAKDGQIRHWQFQAELRAKDALAHQQPSATCPICGGVDNKHVPSCSSLAVTVEVSEQPSAPTAEDESFAPFFKDVEKKTTQELAEIVGVQGSGSRAAESHARGLRNKKNKQTLTPATTPTEMPPMALAYDAPTAEAAEVLAVLLDKGWDVEKCNRALRAMAEHYKPSAPTAEPGTARRWLQAKRHGRKRLPSNLGNKKGA